MGCNAWNHPSNCDCGWGGDTGGGTGGWHGGSVVTIPRPAATGRWGRYEGARFESYTIPNAQCPVCHAKVFFYQSEHGGRVFFDPPLGPPWPKHPCTDGRVSGSGDASFKREPPPPNMVASTAEPSPSKPEQSIDAMRRSGWHPLLELKVRQEGRWRVLEGLDPIDNHRCQIMIEASFEECAPTLLRIDGPERITCYIEQVQGGNDGAVHVIKGRGWFGVSNLEETRIAKAARSGDAGAMRRYAQSRSYRHLGRDNWMSDVGQFTDVQAALFWFDKAARSGSEETIFEHAYLLDLIDLDATYRRWQRDNPKLSLRLAPPEIRTPPAGSLAHSVCVRASERMLNLGALLRTREQYEDDWMDDYYTEQIRPGQEYLEEVASRRHLPRLSAAITAFLKKTQVPPFRPQT